MKVEADIRAQSVMALAATRDPFDLILIDPPYGTGAGQVALDRCHRLGWVSDSAIISIETARDETIELAGFHVDAERVYGKAKITLLRPVAQ